MVLDSALGDIQCLGHLTGGETSCDEPDQFFFARTQTVSGQVESGHLLRSGRLYDDHGSAQGPPNGSLKEPCRVSQRPERARTRREGTTLFRSPSVSGLSARLRAPATIRTAAGRPVPSRQPGRRSPSSRNRRSAAGVCCSTRPERSRVRTPGRCRIPWQPGRAASRLSGLRPGTGRGARGVRPGGRNRGCPRAGRRCLRPTTLRSGGDGATPGDLPKVRPRGTVATGTSSGHLSRAGMGQRSYLPDLTGRIESRRKLYTRERRASDETLD